MLLLQPQPFLLRHRQGSILDDAAEVQQSENGITRLFFSNITKIGDQAWDFVQNECDDYHIVALAESHVSTPEISAWEQKAGQLGRRLYATSARPSD